MGFEGAGQSGGLSKGSVGTFEALQSQRRLSSLNRSLLGDRLLQIHDESAHLAFYKDRLVK